ncbi:MAG TPA: DUF4352 domain-containing protein [Micromonosporaceae bacterium]|nr:DUF4352 domain-containing protein [Micromonosporaceae bacterium]
MIARHRAKRSRFATGVLLLGALAIGGVVTAVTPDTDVHARPFAHRGTVGEPVDGRTFEATVVGFRGAARFATDEIAAPDKEHDTDGIWLIVTLRVVAKDKTTTIGYGAVRDARGRTYLASTRIDQPLVGSGRDLQPGIPVEGDVVFEVPRDAVTSLDLLLADPSLDLRLDALVEVPLPIDATMVDQWLRIPSPGKVSDPKVVA